MLWGAVSYMVRLLNSSERVQGTRFNGPLYRPHGLMPRPYPTTRPTRLPKDRRVLNSRRRINSIADKLAAMTTTSRPNSIRDKIARRSQLARRAGEVLARPGGTFTRRPGRGHA